MTDSPAEGSPSNTNLLVGAGAAGLVLALVAFPSGFLLLAALVAVGALVITFLGNGKTPSDDSATVQLQELPRQSIDHQTQGQRGGSTGGSDILASRDAQLPPRGGTSMAPASSPAVSAEGASSSFTFSPTSQTLPATAETTTWAARPSQQQSAEQEPERQQQAAGPEPVVTTTFTSSGNSQHTSSSTHTVVANGQAPQTTSSSEQGGMSWNASGEGPAPPPAQMQQQALQQGAANQQQTQQRGQPAAAGGAAILARLK